MRLFFWTTLVFACLLSGCHRTSPEERVFFRFQEALERNQRNKAWNFLSSKSQQKFRTLATRTPRSKSSKTTGKSLFLSGEMYWKSHLRIHPKHRPQRKGNQTTLTLRDEMGILKTITMILEKQRWKVDLQATLYTRTNRAPANPR